MVKKLLLVFFVFGTFMMKAQNLYVDSNAASPINESNTTTGWTGQISLISDNTDAQSGLFSLRSESPGDGSTWVEYSFNAVNGQDYTISIWAREGNQSNEPAFANWQGLNGFNTTLISGNGWTEYVFNVTATSNNPAIRVYVSPYRSRFEVGNSVLLDNISIILAGGDTEAPNAVSDLSSSNTSTTSTDLSWSNPGDNVGVTDYEVFQDGGSLGLTGGATTFNVTGLTASTGYAFTVFARDAAGNVSMVSNTENVNTQAGGDTEAPNAVSDLSSSNTSTTSTDLSWSNPGDNVGVTDYEVFQDGGSLGLTGGATTFNVTGLTASTGYAFTVFARDAAGNVSMVSNTENVNTQAGGDTEAPNAVSDLSSSNTSTTSTDLSWSNPGDNVGVTDYEVFQDGGSLGLTGGATTFNVTGLTASTGYAFTVFARDAAGNVSMVSNTENVNTQAGGDTEAPNAVSDLSSSNTSTTSTDLSWSNPGDNVGVTDYEVFQDGGSLGLTGGATTFNVTGLTASTGYAFTVFARDAAGNVSMVSNTENVNTQAGGGVVDYTSANSNMNTVDWTARDLFADRNVGIGTTNTQGYRLAVAGNVIAEGVKVELQGNWPDFVFLKEYNLMGLEEVRQFIDKNGHLPNIPSTKNVEANGIDLGVMNAKLLQKIEELTLYILLQQSEIEFLKKDTKALRSYEERLQKIETQLNPKK